mmetsp:Transcript_7567/g.16944  ORF Transcript_7567/g.16944 Transcript_7567/m.16944 type:complete len:507 (-) Transcript_7567:84-1604(-)
MMAGSPTDATGPIPEVADVAPFSSAGEEAVIADPASPPDVVDSPTGPLEPPAPTWWCTQASQQWHQFLKETHDALAAGDEFKTLCDECMEALQEACSSALSTEEFRVQPFDWTPDVRLEAFGSTKQGTALTTSDIDVRMTFQQFEVRDKDRQLKYLNGIVGFTQKAGSAFKVSMIIANSRIPLLRLIYKGKLSVDLTMGGGMAGESEAMEDSVCIDTYLVALLKSGVNPEETFAFTRLVKAFAKANSLVDAHAGFPSSTTWVYLIIAFLQRERCLPKGSDVFQNIDNGDDENAEEAPTDQTGKGERFVGRLWPVILSASFFLRFLLFVQHLQNRPIKVSIRDGYVCSARAWTNSGQKAPPLFLEHPQANRSSDNLSKSLTWSGWWKVGLRCRQMQSDLRPVKAAAPPKQQEQDALAAGKRLFGSTSAGPCPEPGHDAAPETSKEATSGGTSNNNNNNNNVNINNTNNNGNNHKNNNCNAETANPTSKEVVLEDPEEPSTKRARSET